MRLQNKIFIVLLTSHRGVEGQVDDSSDDSDSTDTSIGRIPMDEVGCLTLHFLPCFHAVNQSAWLPRVLFSSYALIGFKPDGEGSGHFWVI